jgi:hypothetical protein
MKTVYEHDIQPDDVTIPVLNKNIWDSAKKRFPLLPSHIRLIIRSLEQGSYRIDYLIQRTEEGWEESCIVSWWNEFLVYDWDTNVHKIPSFGENIIW